MSSNKTKTAQEKLNWMQEAIGNDDDDLYREVRREVQAVASLVQGYPERQAKLIDTLYNEMKGI